jgi:hypothetical protein
MSGVSKRPSLVPSLSLGNEFTSFGNFVTQGKTSHRQCIKKIRSIFSFLRGTKNIVEFKYVNAKLTTLLLGENNV